jgi:hypothetical protein
LPGTRGSLAAGLASHTSGVATQGTTTQQLAGAIVADHGLNRGGDHTIRHGPLHDAKALLVLDGELTDTGGVWAPTRHGDRGGIWKFLAFAFTLCGCFAFTLCSGFAFALCCAFAFAFTLPRRCRRAGSSNKTSDHQRANHGCSKS